MERRHELAVLAAGVAAFLLAAWATGPFTIDEAPLDLGAGISMLPSGRILVRSDRPVGPMRIPEEHEYFGPDDGAEPRRADVRASVHPIARPRPVSASPESAWRGPPERR